MATMLRISPGTEDPKKAVVGGGDDSPIKNQLDIRDIINFGVAGKHVDMSNPDLRHNYVWLSGKIGAPAAQKLMNRILLYNQQTGKSTLPDEERVKAFYDTPGDDPEIAEIITKTKGLGYGIGQGFRGSRHLSTQELAKGELTMVEPKKTMLRVSK